VLFWIGAAIIFGSHILLLTKMPEHSTIVLTGLAFMIVGSKIGRTFLGIN
jgi:hypothetical protein